MRVILLLLLAAPALYAQGPAADWQTVETAHFRVHFPREYEEWSMRAASRLESVREAVTREIGFAPEQKIDVLVMNPIARANGIAWPLLDGPRIILYTDAPEPEEELGAFGHWIDLLTVHETAHIVHMLRPSRNPLDRALERTLLPLNRITLRAPRWVLEGYATVIEGRLTGAGRPNSTIRAAILRKWAQSGRLPSYSQLDSDQRFLGMSMAYLAGSAFLEWLEQRSGEGSLRKLWARMTARQRRTFEGAFEGVFGEKPERLYGRFTAELTGAALVAEEDLREGELWQETTRGSGDPAVSPDGNRLALVLRPRRGPQRLVVYSTAPPVEEETKFAERIEKILARDPEDVAPVRAKPLAREEESSLTMPDGGDIESPRWLRGGSAILFMHRTRDAEGFLHRDLFLWSPDSNELRRVTRLADVSDADPFPGDVSAIAVRRRFGKTQLVSVDLRSGEVTPRGEESLDVIVSHPRVSPDGTRVAWVAHHERGWRLFVDAADGRSSVDAGRTLPGDVATPEWLSNEELVATISNGGFAELHRIATDGSTKMLTRSSGGAFHPAPAPGGRVYFMALEPDGFVVRTIDSGAPALPAVTFDGDPVGAGSEVRSESGARPSWPLVRRRPAADRGRDALEPAGEDARAPARNLRSLVPALPPVPPVVAPFAAGEVSPPRDYGFGRQELGWFTGESYAERYRAFEVGLRWGDVVGRLDTLVVASFGSDDAPRGAALATAWRGWPVEVGVHLFDAGDDRGGELRLAYSAWGAVAAASAYHSETDSFATFLLSKSSHRYVHGRKVEGMAQLEAGSGHRRLLLGTRFADRVALRYQHDGGENVVLGGSASSILPRSSFARRVLDPALPFGTLAGERYDGWRLEATLTGPLAAFYQRHELDEARVSLAGVELELDMEPNAILKSPGLHLTAGAARVLEEDDVRYWLNLRWRP